MITAATPWEAKPITKALGLGKSRSGRIGRREVSLIETGMGAEKCAAALARLDERNGPDIVLSVGFCGALQAGLKPGDLVADLRGAPVEWVKAAQETAAELGLPLLLGAFHSAAHVLTPEEKKGAGHELRAVAVDMESATLRAWAEKNGAVFLGVRAIFDAMDERAPEAGPDDVSAMAVLRFLTTHASETPRLLMFWPRQARGMGRLGRFLASWLEKI
ncbi:MAG: hypothetical protein NTX64_16075 [Elusimicrobia bacterium]|nr:hypothetical protein [Elusimicrobiota bacterium]